ncbi:dnaJ homolog dnj-5-like [Biomphalaria glabrata]|uniref:DnaJ homolog dnj-5-like n=1 Tax=Biomphalaria glabrata TaxID=6526 RepID=A0A9W3AEC6_BIOGL|nr:dnaJ homolog dnj-5-like [Biomphalaria glabrata]XP_055885555.1 dnaJ homolog dnj-5-like [Biomphalaria glabrata]XP_055885556.1 dnaJ homolog dnj-5-like [Biomphalaria glabrata]
MDSKEDALGKISRQLASMSGHRNEMSNDSSMWTPFSGISAQTTDVPFGNLYTWNPMDLPDFEPLTPSPGAANVPTYLDLTEQSRLSEVHSNQMLSHQGLESQKYISVDAAERRPALRDGISPHGYTILGQNTIPSSYQYEPLGALSHTQSSTSNQSNHSERSRVLPHSTGSSIFLNSKPNENISSIGFTYNTKPEENTFGLESLTRNSLFDPLIGLPLINLNRNMPENPQSLSPKPSLSDSFNYLNTSNIKVDLGLHVSDQYTNNSDGLSLKTGDENVLTSAKKKWHSFDSSLKCSEPVMEPVVSDTQKPSYSDIAKTPKLNKPENITSAETASKFQAFKQVKKDTMPSRPPVKRTSSGSKYWPKSNQGTDTEQSKPPTMSRYGLDHFSEHTISPGSQSGSSENLAQSTRSRTGSGSSAEGSSSAPDDLNSKLSFADSNLLHQEQKSEKVFKAPSPTEHVFFDPRRIFQTKANNKSKLQPQAKLKETNVHDRGKIQSETVLNNDKPTASNASSKLSSSARQHDYINNDLRDANKLTNQISAENGQSSMNKNEDTLRVKENRSVKRPGGRASGVYRRHKSADNGHMENDSKRDDTQHHQGNPRFLVQLFARDKIEEIFILFRETISHYGKLLLTHLIHWLLLFFRLIFYLAVGGFNLALIVMSAVLHWLKLKFSKDSPDTKGSSWSPRDSLRRRVGLEENITLPSTGEEAMKRLLACKGKDPYSILGLRADSTDEEIKKYYRKQAVLVHPDKNQEPGAEEAFKILGHAFEMIGDSSKRKTYDSHTQEANEAEAMREFAEMLSKLQTKIQEAANIMPCDNCHGKHQRFPVERPFYSARFCQRCNVFHAAKEGDVWAETTMLGFRWHYYALMENHVFDITQWMACHKEYFKHMKANYHNVTYRIATEGNKRNKRQAGEPSLEDFINHLINKSAAASEGQSSSWGQSHTPPDDNSWNHSHPGTTGSKQKGRRKKKR